MNAFLRPFFASLLAGLVLVTVVVGLIVIKMDSSSDIEDHSWLHVDIYGEVLEYDPPGGLLGQVTGGGALTLQMILENLAKAEVDERIDGVILQMSSSNNLGMAKMQEIRGAVQRVQAAGKKVYGYADSMDEGTYYLAAVCDSLFTPPSGYIGFAGFSRTSTHLRGLMDKLGINPELHAIRHYKAAAQLLTRTDLTAEAKKNMDWMFADRWTEFVAVLEADRGLDEAAVIALMEMTFFEADEAVAMGLFDELLFWDELEEKLKLEDEDRLRVVSHDRYAEEDPADLDLKGKKTIAVIHAQGNIGGRENSVNPVLGLMMGHETIVAQIDRALADEDVVGIVVRIDSGGGESLASDIMGHAIDRAGDKKPLVVSMADVAASGGYVMSYRAPYVMASPMTVTGSIGSISGKFDMSGFNEMVGLSKDYVTKGPNALIMTDTRPFTPEEAEKFGDSHWKGFRRWMDDVAGERGIAAADIDSLCMGRVWTGNQAIENKLVDALGGQFEAVEWVKAEAGLEADEGVTLMHLPEQQDFVESLLGGGEASAQAVNWAVYRRMRLEAQTTYDYLTGPNMLVVDPALVP